MAAGYKDLAVMRFFINILNKDSIYRLLRKIKV